MEDQLDTQGLALKMRRARRQDGDPAFRDLSRQMGYSISSISRVLAGKSFPRWEFTQKFLRACHVSEEEINGTWRSTWIAVAEMVSPIGDSPADDEAPAIPAHVGTECAQCGALVINQIRHQAWHAAYAPREPGQAARQPRRPDITGTSHTLRSLPG